MGGELFHGVIAAVDELQSGIEGIGIGVSKRQNGGGWICGEGCAENGGHSGEYETMGLNCATWRFCRDKGYVAEVL